MTTFTLDTGGVVLAISLKGLDGTARYEAETYGRTYRWSDLDAFTQGYVEELFADWHHRACVLPFVKGREWPRFEDHPPNAFPASFTDATGKRWDIVRHHGQWKRTDCQTPGEFPAFSDLSPGALKLILADCAWVYGKMTRGSPTVAHQAGGYLWRERNGAGGYDGFPPLTASLSDDGKVKLEVKG